MIQADGTHPNLALMKIARYHRNLGDTLTLQRGMKAPTKSYGVVYISCIFTHNREEVLNLAKQFPEVHVGGCGIDLTTNLPDEIEHMMPLYDLYPDCNFSLGYTSRGCPRNCEFCIVPDKEGKVRPVADIYEFWDHRHGHILLLDNNILALPDHFKRIASQIKMNNLSVDFHQGLDIRLYPSPKIP